MRISSKNIFILFILIAFILSVIVGIQRSKLENDFKQVDLVMSLNKIRELALKDGYDENKLLKQLQLKGISSIAVHEDTIETLSFQGKIAFLKTNDLTSLNYIRDIVISDLEYVSPGELLIMCKDYSLFERIKNYFQQYIGENMVQEYIFNGGEIFSLVLRGDEEELVKLGLGFSKEDIARIQALGFNVILRPKNSPKVTPEIVQQKLKTIERLVNISLIIFDEEEAVGYPSIKMLSETAQFLQENNYPFGIIEFTSQKGIHTIASKISQLAVRVHSITEEEMEKITLNTAIDRWTRAAQERNIRLFYLNPFLKIHEGDLVQYNLDYIERIRNELVRNNYSVGKASLFPTYQVSPIFIYIIGLGIISAGILLLMEFLNISKKHELILFIGSLIFLFIIDKLAGGIFLMKILALASALIFPTLAIIMNKNYFLMVPKNRDKALTNLNIVYCSYLELLKNIFTGITRIMMISLIGGLIIGALLTHYQFILAIQLFSGIKIAYIFPLILVTFYLWWISKEDKRLLIEDFKKPILFEHAFLVFIFLVFGVIYIVRSGNFSFLPVPDIEEKMRMFLETFLVARPRSKEFLIGYPLLSLAIAMNFLGLHYFKLPIVIMGTVAPVTIVNTFCHVHTSLSFSILRTFHGYWLGLLLSIVLTLIIYIFFKNFRTKSDGKKNEQY